MRRCFGLTKNLSRCGRSGDWRFFCHEHKKQPIVWLIFLTFTVLGGAASILSYFSTPSNVLRDQSADASSPLRIAASLYKESNHYPPGTTLAGITWQERYVDIRTHLQNDGESALENIDLYLEMDTNIAGIGQLTNIPGFLASTAGSMPPVWLEGKDEKGTPTVVPIVPNGQISSQVYRIYCPKLLPKSELSLIVASEAINPPSSRGELPQQLFAPRRMPDWLYVRGTYEIYGIKTPVRVHIDNKMAFNKTGQ